MSVKLGDAEVAGFSGGSIDAIDDITITKNSDDEIQAVATVNQNTATGATNPVYDWVGTLAEYNAQNIETLHPDWICYITDDVSGGTSVYTKTEVDNIASGKANVALDNLTSAGKEVCANMAMPSGTYTNLTLGASNSTYTAPADGYFMLKGQTTTATNLAYGLFNISAGSVGMLLRINANGVDFRTFTMASKGQTARVIYEAALNNVEFRFIYANGAQ